MRIACIVYLHACEMVPAEHQKSLNGFAYTTLTLSAILLQTLDQQQSGYAMAFAVQSIQTIEICVAERSHT